MNENLKLVFPFSGPRKEQKLRTRMRQPLVQQFLLWLGNSSRPTKKDATKKEWRVVVLKQRPNTQCRTIGRTGYVSLFFQRRVLEYSVAQNFCQFQFDYFTKVQCNFIPALSFLRSCVQNFIRFFPGQTDKLIDFEGPEMGPFSGPRNGSVFWARKRVPSALHW